MTAIIAVIAIIGKWMKSSFQREGSHTAGYTVVPRRGDMFHLAYVPTI